MVTTDQRFLSQRWSFCIKHCEEWRLEKAHQWKKESQEEQLAIALGVSMKLMVSQNGKEVLAELLISSYPETICTLFSSVGHFFSSVGHFIAFFFLTKLLMASSCCQRKMFFYWKDVVSGHPALKNFLNFFGYLKAFGRFKKWQKCLLFLHIFKKISMNCRVLLVAISRNVI